MRKNKETNIYIVQGRRIKGNTKSIKWNCSITLFAFLFIEFSLYSFLVKQFDGQLFDSIYQDILNAVLYFLLYILICITIFIIKDKAQKENDIQDLFEKGELGKLAIKSLILTVFFFGVFSIKEMTISSLPIIGILVALLLGFVFSLEDALDQEGIQGFKDYIKESLCGLVDSFKDSFSLMMILSIIMVVFGEILADKYPALFKVISRLLFWGIVFICLIYIISYYIIIREIKKQALGREVLILDYSHSRLLITYIKNSLQKKADKYIQITPKEINRKRYDVVVIVDALMQRPNLLQNAKSYIMEDGVIIAPAYTARKKKSKLISEEGYIENFTRKGWKVTKKHTYNFIGISYIELKR